MTFPSRQSPSTFQTIHNMDLDKLIEAILFFKGEPISRKELARVTDKSADEVSIALGTLRERLNGGIVLVENNEEVSLGTHKGASHIIETMAKEDLERDVGKAGLETLTIILYKNEASKRDIDYIRGVNSGFILRNLLIRGLIDRNEKKGERGFVYTPTVELQKYLGVAKLSDLPEYETMRGELQTFLTAKNEEEKE